MKAINIISFDVPYPPNYGGVIDVFYKIKTLHQHGVEVHLHCFEYGRGEQKDLLKYCKSVNYYKRDMSPWWIFSKYPFIIKSRVSNLLRENLLKNDFPILFEGLHTCFLLTDKDFENRVTVFRESNIEHEYYQHLASFERNWIKKRYLKIEADRLQKFEPTILKASCSMIVSKKDWEYFYRKYPAGKHYFIPSFHMGETVNVKKGLGDYVLYHGNLSVSENYQSAEFIIKEIFAEMDSKLIIAGLNPPEHLKDLIEKYTHIQLIENPSDEKMEELIANAQINLLYTPQATGLKLKLLNVLYHGRHCLVNDNMVWGTTLKDVCSVANTPQALQEKIKQLMPQEVNEEMITNRKQVLLENYSNEKNFKRLVEGIDEMMDN